jgi:hypothetical protein
MSGPDCPGRVDVNISEPVHPEEDFFLTFEPVSPLNHRTSKFRFGSNSFYEIRDDKDQKVTGEWSLLPRTPKQFRISVHADNPGLVELEILTNSDSACFIHQPLNTGFQDTILLESLSKQFTPEESPSEEAQAAEGPPIPPIPSGEPVSVELHFSRKSDHAPITFELQPTLEITASSYAKVFDQDRRPTRPLRMTVHPNDIPLFEVEDDRWGKSGLIQVNVLDSMKHIAAYRFRYRTDYPWCIVFLLILIGTLLYVAVESLPAFNKPGDGTPPPGYWKIVSKDRGSKLVLAMFVAIVAILLQNAPGLDLVKFNPTTAKGYIILGFFANIVGLEAIYKKIKGLLES